MILEQQPGGQSSPTSTLVHCGLCHLISLLITRHWCLKHHPNEDLTSVQQQLESELTCKGTE